MDILYRYIYLIEIEIKLSKFRNIGIFLVVSFSPHSCSPVGERESGENETEGFLKPEPNPIGIMKK
jgi:hypothetical protein